MCPTTAMFPRLCHAPNVLHRRMHAAQTAHLTQIVCATAVHEVDTRVPMHERPAFKMSNLATANTGLHRGCATHAHHAMA